MKKTRLHYTMVGVFSINFILVTLAIHFHPTNPMDTSPFQYTYVPVFFSLLSSLLLFRLYDYILGAVNSIIKNKVFGISFFVQIFLYTLLGVFVHFDYFTLVFQIIFIYSAVFLFSLMKANYYNKRIIRVVVNVYYIFTAGIILWTILMGYAIQTGASERWIEEIIFNVYNLLLLMLITINLYHVRHRLYTYMSISKDEILCNNLDITEIIGKKNLLVLYCFVNERSRTLTCSGLIKALHVNGGESAPECSSCREQDWKVTSCPIYKNTYNSILILKKVLESMNLGTFHYPDNKMLIKEIGWRLELKSHVEFT